MGIDVGTTSTKVLVVDPLGKLVSSGKSDYALYFPNVGWAEQDPEEVFIGIKKAIKEALSRIPNRKGEIIGLSLSTQRDTMVVTDENNRPLRNAITWMDSRAGEECEKLKEAFGEDKVYHTTGVPISTIWTYAFILWLKNHEPEVWEKACCFGLVHDFVMCRLGSEKHYLDMTNACQTMMYDFVNQCWDKKLLNYSGLEESRLPILVQPETEIGILSPELADEFGLSHNVKLIAGGGDQQCALVGSGAIKTGDLEVCIGTAANILASIDEPCFDTSHKLICHRALGHERFVMEGAMLSTGKMIEWLANVFYPSDSLSDFYLHLNRDVATKSVPGAGGLIMTPHFEGAASPHWNYDARGICLGLTLSTSRADICCSVLEGIAIEIKKNLNLLDNMGMKAERVVVSGGASNSPVWLQIIADVLGKNVVTLENNECAAIGAAIIAGVGSGIYRNIEHGVANLVTISKIYTPRSAYTEMYNNLYHLNEQSYQVLNEAGIFTKIMGLKQSGIKKEE